MDWSLFLSALLSATLLPGSSEVLLLYLLNQGGDPCWLVVSATLGNLSGSLITYLMGRLGNSALHKNWLRIDEVAIERAERWFSRWGMPSLLLAWLPVVGDPLCLIAGLLRVSPGWFVLLTGIGKAARYSFLAWLI